MPQRRDTATDKLSNIIQVIQLGRKTGVLSVERGEGSTYEEGTITFVNGQVTHANTGLRSNLEAFYWLNAWTECRFTFTSQAATGIRLPQRLPLPLSSPVPDQTSYPISSLREQQPTLPIRQSSTGEQVKLPIQDYASTNEARRQYTIREVPHRITSLDEALRRIEQAGLSRIHRHLLLLVDGYRDIAELVRLTGHTPDEVVMWLHQLERIGAIHQDK